MTARKYLDQAWKGPLRPRQPRPPLIDPYADYLRIAAFPGLSVRRRWLEIAAPPGVSGCNRARHQRYRHLARILSHLRSELPGCPRGRRCSLPHSTPPVRRNVRVVGVRPMVSAVHVAICGLASAQAGLPPVGSPGSCVGLASQAALSSCQGRAMPMHLVSKRSAYRGD